MFRWCEWGILGVMFPNISESFEWFSLHFRSLFDWLAVADPGEGPGRPARLVFRPKGRPKGRKKFLETGPPLSQDLDDRPHTTKETIIFY